MRLLTGLLKTNVKADLFAPDDVNSNDAVLTFVKSVELQIDTYYGATLMAVTRDVLPYRNVLQNFTDNFGKSVFADTNTTGAVAYRITTIVPIVSNMTGIELYRHSLVRI